LATVNRAGAMLRELRFGHGKPATELQTIRSAETLR